MFEKLLDLLPESVRACRRLYDPQTGGYHLPLREANHPISLAQVDAMRERHTQPQYDCIEVPVADLLGSLVINIRAQLILETGTSRGFSTAHLAAAARCVHGPDAKVISIDLAPTANLMFEGSPLASTIVAVKADSLQIDLAPLTAGAEFDFLFLDSLHSYAHLSREIERFLPMLKVGGLLALHDTFFYDGLGLVTLMLMQLDGLETLSMPTHRLHAHQTRSPGVSLFRKLAPIAASELRFPRGAPTLQLELVHIEDPGAIANHLGMAALRRDYVAQGLLAASARDWDSPALLAPAISGVAQQSSVLSPRWQRPFFLKSSESAPTAARTPQESVSC